MASSKKINRHMYRLIKQGIKSGASQRVLGRTYGVSQTICCHINRSRSYEDFEQIRNKSFSSFGKPKHSKLVQSVRMLAIGAAIGLIVSTISAIIVFTPFAIEVVVGLMLGSLLIILINLI
jgi:hypothetical protein